MPFQNLYNHIFDTTEAGVEPVEMLERQVTRYPYFTVAHFFLLKHSRQGHPGYAGVAAKAAMHFNHPFFLHQQLHKVADTQVTTDNEFATVFHTPDNIPDEILEVQDKTVQDEIYPEEKMNEPAFEADAAQPATDASEANSQAAAVMQEQLIQEQPTALEVAPADVEDNAEIPTVQEASMVNEGATSTDTFAPTDTEEPAVLPQATQPEPVATVDITPVPEETPAPKEAPLFEPLFATDYFASQGIKLREEVLANDKLGKQLRSFTDWLKTMKKVHEGKLPAGNDTLDLSVQKLAEKSNKEEDVLTETMAEVYLQQGKQHKAKEIYEKLSLLNPSKMAYFAAKIDQIQ